MRGEVERLVEALHALREIPEAAAPGALEFHGRLVADMLGAELVEGELVFHEEYSVRAETAADLLAAIRRRTES